MLHTLQPYKGSKKSRMRVGRGRGSGKGTFSGRGVKGHAQRAGGGMGPHFEGGQTPLIRKQPKRGGFRNPNREEFEVLNLDTLEKELEAGKYSPVDLKEARLVHGVLPIKILGRGKITKKLQLSVHAASKTARTAVEKAGGSVTIV